MPLVFQAQEGLSLTPPRPHANQRQGRADLSPSPLLWAPAGVTPGAEPLQPVPISQTRKPGAALLRSEHRAQPPQPAGCIFPAFPWLPPPEPLLSKRIGTGPPPAPPYTSPQQAATSLVFATFSTWALTVTLSLVKSLVTSLMLKNNLT